MVFQTPNTRCRWPQPEWNRSNLAVMAGQSQKPGGLHAGRAGQLGQQPKWGHRHSLGLSHQLHNKVIMGLGIKLVTCVIILLRIRTEKAFLKSCSLAPPRSVAAETQMSEHTHKHIYTRQ